MVASDGTALWPSHTLEVGRASLIQIIGWFSFGPVCAFHEAEWLAQNVNKNAVLKFKNNGENSFSSCQDSFEICISGSKFRSRPSYVRATVVGGGAEANWQNSSQFQLTSFLAIFQVALMIDAHCLHLMIGWILFAVETRHSTIEMQRHPDPSPQHSSNQLIY